MDFRAFEATPGFHVMVLPDLNNYLQVAISNDLLSAAGKKRHEMIGKSYFEVFETATGVNHEVDEKLRNAFQYVVKEKTPYQTDLQRNFPGKQDPLVNWTVKIIPVMGNGDEVEYLLVSTQISDATVTDPEEKQPLQNKEKIYELFMSAPMIISIVKGDNYIVELANEGMLNVWGKKNQEVIGKPLLEAVPELAGQGFIEQLDEVRKTGVPFRAYESPAKIKKNDSLETYYFDFIYQPYFENSSDTIAAGVIGVAHDVTEQVYARKKIIESEEKYRGLFESMEQGFCILELIFDAGNQPVDYRFLETNPVFEKQTGLKSAVGKTAKNLVPNLEQHWFDMYGKVALTGEPLHFVEGSGAMGKIFEVNAFRLGGTESRKVALLFTDITERKTAEDAMRQSEENLRNIILQSPVAMCIMRGPSFRIEIANEAMYQIWGRAKEEVLNKPIFEALPDAREQGLEQLIENVYRTGTTFRANERPVELNRNHKLETVYQNFVYQPYIDGKGAILGVLAISVDVTEQVLNRRKIEEIVKSRTRELAAANEALVRSNQELLRSNENLQEFAYAASHDLKEPVRKIHFFADRLKNSLGHRLQDDEKRSFERMEAASRRMSSLIDDLLSFSQVSLKPRLFEEIDLNELMSLVLADLDLEIEESGANIITDELFSIYGHQRQLQQAFQNLVSNALKYRKPGELPSIQISAAKADQAIEGMDPRKNYHVISISDSGIGFEQKDAERIFNVFTRLHGNAEFRGTGIGLSIVRKVIENHNGIITAESAPGEGATFRIYFPEQQLVKKEGSVDHA